MARKPRPAARGQVRVPAHHYGVAARYREVERRLDHSETIEIIAAMAAFWGAVYVIEIVGHLLGF